MTSASDAIFVGAMGLLCVVSLPVTVRVWRSGEPPKLGLEIRRIMPAAGIVCWLVFLAGLRTLTTDDITTFDALISAGLIVAIPLGAIVWAFNRPRVLVPPAYRHLPGRFTRGSRGQAP